MMRRSRRSGTPTIRRRRTQRTMHTDGPHPERPIGPHPDRLTRLHPERPTGARREP